MRKKLSGNYPKTYPRKETQTANRMHFNKNALGISMIDDKLSTVRNTDVADNTDARLRSVRNQADEFGEALRLSMRDLMMNSEKLNQVRRIVSGEESISDRVDLTSITLDIENIRKLKHTNILALNGINLLSDLVFSNDDKSFITKSKKLKTLQRGNLLFDHFILEKSPNHENNFNVLLGSGDQSGTIKAERISYGLSSKRGLLDDRASDAKYINTINSTQFKGFNVSNIPVLKETTSEFSYVNKNSISREKFLREQGSAIPNSIVNTCFEKIQTNTGGTTRASKNVSKYTVLGFVVDSILGLSGFRDLNLGSVSVNNLTNSELKNKVYEFRDSTFHQNLENADFTRRDLGTYSTHKGFRFTLSSDDRTFMNNMFLTVTSGSLPYKALNASGSVIVNNKVQINFSPNYAFKSFENIENVPSNVFFNPISGMNHLNYVKTFYTRDVEMIDNDLYRSIEIGNKLKSEALKQFITENRIQENYAILPYRFQLRYGNLKSKRAEVNSFDKHERYFVSSGVITDKTPYAQLLNHQNFTSRLIDSRALSEKASLVQSPFVVGAENPNLLTYISKKQAGKMNETIFNKDIAMLSMTRHRLNKIYDENNGIDKLIDVFVGANESTSKNVSYFSDNVFVNQSKNYKNYVDQKSFSIPKLSLTGQAVGQSNESYGGSGAYSLFEKNARIAFESSVELGNNVINDKDYLTGTFRYDFAVNNKLNFSNNLENIIPSVSHVTIISDDDESFLDVRLPDLNTAYDNNGTTGIVESGLEYYYGYSTKSEVMLLTNLPVGKMFRQKISNIMTGISSFTNLISLNQVSVGGDFSEEVERRKKANVASSLRNFAWSFITPIIGFQDRSSMLGMLPFVDKELFCPQFSNDLANVYNHDRSYIQPPAIVDDKNLVAGILEHRDAGIVDKVREKFGVYKFSEEIRKISQSFNSFADLKSIQISGGFDHNSLYDGSIPTTLERDILGMATDSFGWTDDKFIISDVENEQKRSDMLVDYRSNSHRYRTLMVDNALGGLSSVNDSLQTINMLNSVKALGTSANIFAKHYLYRLSRNKRIRFTDQNKKRAEGRRVWSGSSEHFLSSSKGSFAHLTNTRKIIGKRAMLTAFDSWHTQPYRVQNYTMSREYSIPNRQVRYVESLLRGFIDTPFEVKMPKLLKRSRIALTRLSKRLTLPNDHSYKSNYRKKLSISIFKPSEKTQVADALSYMLNKLRTIYEYQLIDDDNPNTDIYQLNTQQTKNESVIYDGLGNSCYRTMPNLPEYIKGDKSILPSSLIGQAEFYSLRLIALLGTVVSHLLSDEMGIKNGIVQHLSNGQREVGIEDALNRLFSLIEIFYTQQNALIGTETVSNEDWNKNPEIFNNLKKEFDEIRSLKSKLDQKYQQIEGRAYISPFSLFGLLSLGETREFATIISDYLTKYGITVNNVYGKVHFVNAIKTFAWRSVIGDAKYAPVYDYLRSTSGVSNVPRDICFAMTSGGEHVARLRTEMMDSLLDEAQNWAISVNATTVSTLTAGAVSVPNWVKQTNASLGRPAQGLPLMNKQAFASQVALLAVAGGIDNPEESIREAVDGTLGEGSYEEIGGDQELVDPVLREVDEEEIDGNNLLETTSEVASQQQQLSTGLKIAIAGLAGLATFAGINYYYDKKKTSR